VSHLLFFFLDGDDFRESAPAILASFSEIASKTDGARVVDQKRHEEDVLDKPQWDVGITLPLPSRLEVRAIVGLISKLCDLCRRFDVEMVAGLVSEDGAAEDVEYINGETEPDSFAEDFVRAIEG